MTSRTRKKDEIDTLDTAEIETLSDNWDRSRRWAAPWSGGLRMQTV